MIAQEVPKIANVRSCTGHQAGDLMALTASKQAVPAQYPKVERAELVLRDVIAAYLGCIFGAVRYKANHFIDVRGIGEKGTDREGRFSEDGWAQPGVALQGVDSDEALTDAVTACATRWAQHNIATYIVPAVLKEARGSSAAVELMPAALVDLDTGDTWAKADYLKQHLGTPTMTVKSGGMTETGTPKLHLYWVFDEPCADVARVVDLRHDMAAKVGGDLQFGRGTPDNPYGRAHQPIRIPGTVHSKKDVPAVVVLADHDASRQYDLDILAEAVRRMPPSPWAVKAVAPEKHEGALAFSFSPDTQYRNIQDTLDNTICEGGEDRTRWSEFNAAAGFYIGRARRGEMTLEQAREELRGWVATKMEPAWPAHRVDREFNALVTVDENKNGAMPAANPLPVLAGRQKRTLAFVRVDQLIATPKPLSWLIRGMLETDSLALIFGDPGVGKSFVAVDWAVCVATGTPFAGNKVQKGHVLFIAGEGGNGLTRRFAACAMAKGLSLDGAPLYISTMATAMTDDASMRELLEIVAEHVRQHGVPLLIIVDTVARNFGSGDENSTKDMSRFVAANDAIRDLTGACVLLVHHSGHGDKARARGSIALKGALDWEYGLTKDAGAIVLECTKVKDAEPPSPMAFRLSTVDLGVTDEEGEPVTSAVLTPALYMQSASKGKTGRGKNQTIALRVLNEAMKECEAELRRAGSNADAWIGIREWRDRCATDGLDAKRFREVFNGLLEKGFVTADGQRVALQDPEFHVI